MAIGDSIIRVSIIGDVRNLQQALVKADQSTGGLVKSLGKTFLALGAVREGFQFAQSSLDEADRLGDAMARLNDSIGVEFTNRLEDTADNFTRIGASSQDMLELEAIFAAFGTAAGIADPQIASFAESVAATATAFSLVDDQGRDASAVMDLITKAAGGSEKAARELGVALIDTKDPTQQLANILAQLKPTLDAATTGTADLEQKQRELQAKVEDLSGKLGQQLEPALVSVLTVITDGIDDIGGAIWGFQELTRVVVRFGHDTLGPLANVRDALHDILNTLGLVSQRAGAVVGTGASFRRESTTVRNVDDFQSRNGTSPTVRSRVGGP